MDKRIVYSPVLIPNKPDSDGDVVTAEQIEDFAHKFMSNYRNIDLQHTLNNIGVPVESFITKEKYAVETGEGKKEYPKGTWIMAVKVLHDETWDKIKSKELTGFSIMAVKKTVFDDVAAKSTEGVTENDLIAVKGKTTLKDLGDDLEVVFVSIVDEPAVEDATFFTIKSKKSFMDKLKEKVLKTAKDDSGITRKEVSSLNEEEVKELLQAISDLQEKVSKLEGEQEAEENNDTSENPEETPEEEETEEVEKEDSTDSGETSETSEETDTSEKEEEEDNKEDLEARVADLQKQIEDLKGKGSAKKEKSRKAKGSDFNNNEEEDEPVVKSKFERDAFGRRVDLKL